METIDIILISAFCGVIAAGVVFFVRMVKAMKNHTCDTVLPENEKNDTASAGGNQD